MRILLLNTDYAGFLDRLYRDNPGLENRGYQEQRAVRNETLFGFADFYTRGYEALGHTAAEIHVDNPWAQAAWAREHGLRFDPPAPRAAAKPPLALISWLRFRLQPYRDTLRPIAQKLGLLPRLDDSMTAILLAQIADFRPDVIHVQNMKVISSDVVRQARNDTMSLVTQIGVDPPRDIDLSVYDIGLSLIPWVVEYFRSQGLLAAQVDLAFEPRVLGALGPPPLQDIEVSFVGSLSSSHAARVEFLETIARAHPLQIWVPSLNGIPASSPLHACRRGEVYGREMYDILRRSKISLNSHIDVARGSAGNLRLYEATGVGSMLLTDDLADLNRLFQPGEEVATYHSTQDCIEKISYYLSHPEERTRIAAAGQRRTLRDHTYALRTQRISQILSEARADRPC